MEEHSVAIRLKHFMEYSELSNSQFADRCGIPRPSLSQLLSGRNKKLSDVVVKQIHDAFPQMSVLWLMFGEGDMLMPPPINPALASEAEKFMDVGVDDDSEANLKDLSVPQIVSNMPLNQQVSHSYTNVVPLHEIAKVGANPRKVKSITVFYDDNSYETFIPGNK